jgi:CBS domain-containing protein
MRVENVMTVDVVTTTPETSLKEVARVLSDRGISGLPVVDDDGRIAGVISEADVLAKVHSAPDPRVGVVRRLLGRDKRRDRARFGARVVRDTMTSPAITIEPHWSVSVAAERMVVHGVNRLPVTQRERLVGIVTRADLVGAFARSDEEVADETRALVALQQELWRDESAVEVTIDAGDVTLAGQVRNRAEAEVLCTMVRTVPGVVTVRSALSWSEA